MKWDDLLNKPYKPHGRGPDSYDCYGLVMECCKRNGQTLKDPVRDLESLDKNLVEDYIAKGINVRKIGSPKIGCIAEIDHKGRAHVGFMVSRNTVLHTTVKGVKASPLAMLKILSYYEVV